MTPVRHWQNLFVVSNNLTITHSEITVYILLCLLCALDPSGLMTENGTKTNFPCRQGTQNLIYLPRLSSLSTLFFLSICEEDVTLHSSELNKLLLHTFLYICNQGKEICIFLSWWQLLIVRNRPILPIAIKDPSCWNNLPNHVYSSTQPCSAKTASTRLEKEKRHKKFSLTTLYSLGTG